MAEASVLAAPSAHLTDNSRKAIWAAAIGNLLEWYDFGVYAYLAGLIVAPAFWWIGRHDATKPVCP